MPKLKRRRPIHTARLLADFLRSRPHRHRLPPGFAPRPCRARPGDANADRRLRLILALDAANDPADRRWCRLLLRLTLRSYARGLCWDVRDPVALLVFALYRWLQPRDLGRLWSARHRGGSDSYASLDAELTFGFSLADTLARLRRRRPRRALYRDFAADLQQRQHQPGARYRSRADYLDYFARVRQPAHRESLAEELEP